MVLTPWTCEASVASLVVKAPGLFCRSSNQPMSCPSMALKPNFLSRLVSSSPDLAKVYPWGAEAQIQYCTERHAHRVRNQKQNLHLLDYYLQKLCEKGKNSNSDKEQADAVDLVTLFFCIQNGEGLWKKEKKRKGGFILEMSVLLCVKFVHDSLLPCAEAHPRTKGRPQSSRSPCAKAKFLTYPKVSQHNTFYSC